MPAAGKDYRGAQNCMLSGWGLVKRYPQTLADRLQKVTGKIWGARELLRQYWSLPDYVVGFGEPSQNWPACMGDSGGPLVCPNGSGSYDVIGVSLLAPAPAPANPVSSPKSHSTEDGFPRSLAELSKSVSTFLFSVSFVLVDKM